MKTNILLLIILLQLNFSPVFAQFEVKLNDELFISKISQSVYVATHNFPWESNSLIIKASDKEVVLIDTPYDSSATSLMLNWIKTNLKPSKITAVITGFHVDNLGGNGCLLQNKIDIYGSDLTVKMIDERGDKTRQQMLSWLKNPKQEKYYRVYESMVFYKPNKVFRITEGLNLKTGNLSFEVYYPGESHSPDNVTVYIKEMNLLFGGCMIKAFESKDLGFTGDANLAEWPKSVEKVMNKYPHAEIVIPHHGKWGGKELLKRTIELSSK